MADINDAGWRVFPCNQRSIGYGIEDDEDMAPWAYAVYDPDFNLLVHIKNTFEELSELIEVNRINIFPMDVIHD